jgi:hypothetical protein
MIIIVVITIIVIIIIKTKLSQHLIKQSTMNMYGEVDV